MKIEIVRRTTSGILAVTTSHKGQVLTWDTSTYAKTTERTLPEDIDGMFAEINRYIFTLPAVQQQEIFDIYKRVYAIISQASELSYIRNKLQDEIKKLYDILQWERIRDWIMVKTDIRIPESVKDEIDPLANHVSAILPEDGTYIRDDYRNLVALSLSLRPMIPIWGEYIKSTRSSFENYDKEYRAMGLLSKSALIRSDPIDRLRRYILTRIDQDISLTASIHGMGSAELPDWLLGKTSVRRLAVSPLRPRPDGTTIISNLYSFISQAIRTLDSSFSVRVTKKNDNGLTTEEKNNLSVVEKYKIKQSVSDGDLVIPGVFTLDARRTALVVEPGLDLAKLEECLRHVSALQATTIHPSATSLTRWIMATCLPARSISQLNKLALLRTMAIAQSILWHWEFYDLAALVTATPIHHQQDQMVGSPEVRTRVSKDLIKELERLYPYHRPPNNKTIAANQVNVGVVAIEAFYALISQNNWMLHAPPDLISKTNRIATSKMLIIPADIKNQIARLICIIGTR